MPVDNSKFYGINKGGAQVIDTTSSAQQQFGQILARQQAQRQLEQKQLADQAAQLKPDGLRNDADRADYFKSVNDWRNQAIAAQNELDPLKKAQLKAQSDQAYLQTQALVSKSKQQGIRDNAFNTFAMNDATRHQLTDDAVTKGLANTKLGVNDPNIISDYSTLQRQVDHKKIMDMLDKSDQGLLKQTQFDTPTLTRAKVGNRMATFINNSRTVDPNDRAQMYSQMYDAQPDVKKFFNDVYPEPYANTQLTPQQQRDAAIQSYIKQSGDVAEYHAPIEKQDQAPDNFYAHHMFSVNHPINPAAGQMTPAQTLLTTMQQQTPGTGEKLASLAPKGQYGNQQIGMGIDASTGEHVFHFPAHIDQKAVEFNKDMAAKWAKEFPGLPYDPSTEGYSKLKETVVAPKKEYRLNPNSPDYVAQAAQMAKEQNINLSQLNQIEGVKGGHGQIPQVKLKGQPTQQVLNKRYKASNGKSYSHSDLLKLGYTEDQIKEATQMGNLK